MSRPRILIFATVGVSVAWIAGCGDGSTDPIPPPPPPPAPPRATTVSVTPPTAELTALGATLQLAAEVRDQNGQVMAGVTVTWSSGSPAVATVDASGLATAVGNGTATISATAGAASGTAEVTVMQTVDSVAVSPGADTIAVGDTLRLAAEAFDRNGQTVAGAVFEWSSDDAAVATVDASGLVRGTGEGTATITATAGSAAGTFEITVESPDRAALVALYNATDGPHWVNNENWLTDAPLGEWYGVRTDAWGRVARLTLPDNDLSGPIPPELGDLTHLETLWLFANSLSGPIPPGLGQLARLKDLLLAENDLSGPIPSELGSVSRLERLTLFSNGLSGPIPPEAGQLTRLRELLLSSNDLSGPIPPDLGNLDSLERLNLQRNDLSGPIPSELARLTRLEEIILGDNNLSGRVPPELMSMAALERLVLSGNRRLCAPEDPGFLAWLLEHAVYLYRCGDSGVRRLPSALMREDGNGMSLALPDDLRNTSSVTVSDPSVVSASVAGGWLELSPQGLGSAEVEVFGSGSPAVVEVWVRAAIGTFGIDLFLDQPAPLGYEREIVEAADWWSYLLDGTEWPDRRAGCPTRDPFGGKATALADELLLGVRVEDIDHAAGFFDGCFFPVVAGGVPALDPGGGYVTVDDELATNSQGLLRHEIGHALGLVSWGPDTGLTTEDGKYFIGPRAVEAFLASGGDSDLSGVPVDGSHWGQGVRDFMSYWWVGSANSISLGALVDAGYVIDLSKATAPQGPGRQELGGGSMVLGRPRVFVEHRPQRRGLPQ